MSLCFQLSSAVVMLAIALGGAPAAVLAERPSSRHQLGGVTFTQPAPPTGPTHATPESCPYRFDSDMPADTFCVYRGVAWDGADEVCATDVVVIWSSVASPASANRTAADVSALDGEVYLGFVADPGLVIRALVDARQSDRAEIVQYTAGSGGAPQPIAGQMTLPAVRLGSAEVLSIDLREPRHFPPGSCALASYSGTFFGMIRRPRQTTSDAPFIGDPRVQHGAHPKSRAQ